MTPPLITILKIKSQLVPFYFSLWDSFFSALCLRSTYDHPGYLFFYFIIIFCFFVPCPLSLRKIIPTRAGTLVSLVLCCKHWSSDGEQCKALSNACWINIWRSVLWSPSLNFFMFPKPSQELCRSLPVWGPELISYKSKYKCYNYFKN